MRYSSMSYLDIDVGYLDIDHSTSIDSGIVYSGIVSLLLENYLKINLITEILFTR